MAGDGFNVVGEHTQPRLQAHVDGLPPDAKLAADMVRIAKTASKRAKDFAKSKHSAAQRMRSFRRCTSCQPYW